VHSQQPGILSIPLSEVLMEVDPRTPTGQTYTLTSSKPLNNREVKAHEKLIIIMFTRKKN
jgi:hypothetical protein